MSCIARQLMTQVNSLCDVLHNLLLLLPDIEDFSIAEREKLVEAVIAIDSASVVLVYHAHKNESER